MLNRWTNWTGAWLKLPKFIMMNASSSLLLWESLMLKCSNIFFLPRKKFIFISIFFKGTLWGWGSVCCFGEGRQGLCYGNWRYGFTHFRLQSPPALHDVQWSEENAHQRVLSRKSSWGYGIHHGWGKIDSIILNIFIHDSFFLVHRPLYPVGMRLLRHYPRYWTKEG